MTTRLGGSGPPEPEGQELERLVAELAYHRSEQHRAEAERRQRVYFLESLERVDGALKGEETLEEILRRVLDVCLDVFGSDRAWLLYPCNPDAPSWRVLMERTREGFPGALTMGVEVPMLEEAREVFRAALVAEGPVAYDTRTGLPLPPAAADRFGIRSQLTAALRPRVGEPWLFGLHQCSHPRVWSEEDLRLFREVGRRVSDAVSSLLFLRDLIHREESYRELVEGTSDLIARIDAEGRLLFVNHRALEVYGLPPEACVGRSCFDFVHPEDRERTRAALAGWVQGRARSATFENRQVSLSGRVREMHWVVNLHYDEEGRFSNGGAIGRDVGEQRRAERERLELERQVQHAQKLESLGVLAGGIAHDFNNLLMAMLGNADLALLELSREDPARLYVERAAQAAHRAAELTRQMLAYSGKGHFVVGPVEVSRLVGEMGRLLGTVMSKKAEVAFELAEGLPPVEGDAGQLRQVVMNLLTNASESLGEGRGRIAVRTGVEEVDAATLKSYQGGEAAAPGRFVFLQVADTGCGMDGETLDRLFDPFFTTKFAGRGLGLAAVLGIVRGHRGAIRVDSEPGVGTTFRVLLPAGAGAASVPQSSPTLEPDRKSAGSAGVLLVDDEPAVVEVGEAVLRRAGYRVLTAGDGREGVEVYLRHRGEIDLVILDMTMPRLDGAETFRELRRLDPGVQVVLSSGYAEQEASRRFGGEGLSGFIQKPYRAPDLLRLVHRLLAAPGR